MKESLLQSVNSAKLSTQVNNTSCPFPNGDPRRRRAHMTGHVTGSFGGGSHGDSKGGGIHNSISQNIDLA